MIKSTFAKIVFPLVFAALVFAACSKDEPESSLLSSNDTILRYIPADTPYVVAGVEPLPDELLDKMEPKLTKLLGAYQTILREVVVGRMTEAAWDEPGEEEKAQRVSAFIDELASLMSIEGLREAGISRDATGAFYGMGLLPVLRLADIDGAALDAAIAKLEEQAGNKLPVAEVEGGGYRYIDGDEVRIIIAVFADQLVVTFAPQDFGDAQIAQLLGVTPPATTIADAGVLEAIATEYAFTAHYAGFVDIEAVASVFVDAPVGLNADLLALAGHDTPDLSDVCKAEVRSIASVVPRMVLGYTKIDADSLDSSFVVELRDDIAAGLAALPGAVPGLGGDRGGLMSFGMGIDVKAAREFVAARVEAIESEPFECEHLDGLTAAAQGARAGLQQPLPPMVYDFRGFLAIIDEIEGLDIATQTPPTSVDGRFLLAMDNAQALVAMGAMFSPELAQLDLQADGVPVALDLPQLAAMGMTAHTALTENALALAVGDASDVGLGKMLDAPVADNKPFLSFSLDAGRYYSFLGDAITQAPTDGGENPPSPELQSALKDAMSAVGELYDRMTVDILLTERGVEMNSQVTLQD